jgi:hypothetical protein
VSKQKHDLARIKKTKTSGHPPRNKTEKRKERSKRIAENYDRAETRFQEVEKARRVKDEST